MNENLDEEVKHIIGGVFDALIDLRRTMPTNRLKDMAKNISDSLVKLHNTYKEETSGLTKRIDTMHDDQEPIEVDSDIIDTLKFVGTVNQLIADRQKSTPATKSIDDMTHNFNKGMRSLFTPKEEDDKVDRSALRQLMEDYRYGKVTADFVQDAIKDMNISVDYSTDPIEVRKNAHKEVCVRLNKMYAKKNSDYGDSFAESLDNHGLLAYIIRAQDKMYRLRTLNSKDIEVVDESIRDTLEDLANYSIMASMWIDSKD